MNRISMKEVLVSSASVDFTFYWRTGKREVLKGIDPADALNKAGYSAGAVRALDFYVPGINEDYEWDSTLKLWRQR